MIDRLLSPAGAIRAGLFREPLMLVMAWLPMRSPVPAIPMPPVSVRMADRAIRPAIAAVPLQQIGVARVGGPAGERAHASMLDIGCFSQSGSGRA